MLNEYHTDTVKLSFVLFDEIEKASDALWNLLLGILDKATLTLGDNRRVDFSTAMIFMTSNLGASEMNSVLRPSLGFAAGEIASQQTAGQLDGRLSDKIATVATAAAMSHLYSGVCEPDRQNRSVQPARRTGTSEVLAIELSIVQQRVLNSATGKPFVFTLTEDAKQQLLIQGTRPEVWSPPSEASHRPVAGTPALQPHRDRAGARWRSY